MFNSIRHCGSLVKIKPRGYTLYLSVLMIFVFLLWQTVGKMFPLITVGFYSLWMDNTVFLCSLPHWLQQFFHLCYYYRRLVYKLSNIWSALKLVFAFLKVPCILRVKSCCFDICVFFTCLSWQAVFVATFKLEWSCSFSDDSVFQFHY